MDLPTTSARDMTGRRLRLPAEMEGRLNVLLLYLSSEGEAEARNWVLYIKQMEQAHGSLCHYLIPAPGASGLLGRLVTGLRLLANIRERATRRRYLLLRASREALFRALEVNGAEALHICLVDRSGRVHWREVGHITPEKIRGLAEAAEMARSRAGTA